MFDAVHGGLTSRTTGATSQVQNLTYDWDKVGNLAQRKDNNLSLTEHFYYDSLYRLDYSTLNGTMNLDLSYDAIGNVMSKTSTSAPDNVGSYTYDATRKHAVLTAGTHSYGYDANGNMITRDGSSIAYTSFNVPSQVNAGSNSTRYFYDAWRNRYKEITLTAAGGSLPAGTETTISVGGIFEVVTRPTGVIEYKHYISAGKDPVAVRTLRSNSVNDVRYFHPDHLDGVDAITDESRAVVAHLSYAAYGSRRASGTWTGAPASGEWGAVAAVTHRGLTMLEHADSVGLIHMNGRMYDPQIGRFISPDPVIIDALGSQGVNRYAYVGNNPLSLTDRSGFSPDGAPSDQVVVTGSRSNSGGGGGGGVWDGAGGYGAGADRNAVAANEANANIQKAPLTATPPTSTQNGPNDDEVQVVVEAERHTAAAVAIAPAIPSSIRLIPPVVVQALRIGGEVVVSAASTAVSAVAMGAVLLLAPSNGISGHDFNDEAVGHLMMASKIPKDARDPNGAKAPGKPGENEGFKDPKAGEEWVTDDKGRGGWKDENGNVWQPTGWGSQAHGGPHWDVQRPNGGYVNVYPGGKTR